MLKRDKKIKKRKKFWMTELKNRRKLNLKKKSRKLN